MSPRESAPPTDRLGWLEILVLILSVYVLAAMLVELTVPLPLRVQLLLSRIDFAVCLVFLTEFFVNLRRAPSKLAYLKWGWIDLLSSIPVWEPLRWGRLVRAVRIIRLLRAFRSARNVIRFLFRHRTQGVVGTAAVAAFVVLIFSSIAILIFEQDPASTITTPVDAAWWAITTVTTVGYGDKVPVTIEGKAVAAVLMIAGIGLFSLLSGLIARLLIEPDLQHDETQIAELVREVRALRESVERLEKNQRDS